MFSRCCPIYAWPPLGLNGERGEAKLGGCRVSGADPKRHYRAIPEFWERTAVRNCWPFMIHITYYVPD